MGNMLWKHHSKVLASVILMAVGFCMAGFGLQENDRLAKGYGFDWEAFNRLYNSMEATAVSTSAGLFKQYGRDVDNRLPLAPPDPRLPIHVGLNRSTFLNVDRFPRRLLDRLVPVEREINGRIYIAYPVTVREDSKSRERILAAADGRTIAKMAALKGYDPYWLAREKLALYKV